LKEISCIHFGSGSSIHPGSGTEDCAQLF
jgi:hypothetical protein